MHEPSSIHLAVRTLRMAYADMKTLPPELVDSVHNYYEAEKEQKGE